MKGNANNFRKIIYSSLPFPPSLAIDNIVVFTLLSSLCRKVVENKKRWIKKLKEYLFLFWGGVLFFRIFAFVLCYVFFFLRGRVLVGFFFFFNFYFFRRWCCLLFFHFLFLAFLEWCFFFLVGGRSICDSVVHHTSVISSSQKYDWFYKSLHHQKKYIRISFAKFGYINSRPPCW